MRYRKTFAEAYREIYENAATEIQKQVAKGGMDKNMFQKSVDLLKSKKYDELKTFLKKSDTSPREYVMDVIAKKEPSTFKKMYGSQTGYYSLMNQQEIRIRPKSAIEKIQPFMISYSKDGKHAGFEGGDTLQDIQNKAQKLRAKGFTIDKMGRNNPPVKENIEVQVTKKGSGPVNKRSSVHDFDNPAAAKKWIKWYKTGNMKDVESIKMFDLGKAMKYEELEEKEPKKDPETLEAQIITLKGQLSLIKQKLENEKNKVVKPQPNKETGEVPLRTGIANAILDKKIDTKKIIKLKKKEEIPVGGKTKIQLNPNADIGVFAGGNATNSGNLH